jgi:DNA-binding CsgD family transcriptional regulator
MVPGTEELSRRHHHVPLFALCRTYYADVLIATGRWPEAEQILRPAPDADAAPPQVVERGLVLLARLGVRQGRVDEAARLVGGLHGDAQAAAVLAEVHLARG